MKVKKLSDIKGVRNSPPDELVQMENPIDKRVVIARAGIILPIIAGIYKRSGVRLSGPTATGKTTLINALLRSQDNFAYGCEILGKERKVVNLVPIPVPHLESARDVLEVVQTNSEGQIEIVDSPFVELLKLAEQRRDAEIYVAWLQENQRVIGTTVSNAFVELAGTQIINMPDGRQFPGHLVSWICDDNATSLRKYDVAPADDANKDRFPIGLEQAYDLEIMQATFESRCKEKSSPYYGMDSREIQRTMDLAERIHERQNAGELASIAPVTPRSIEEYLDFRAVFSHWPAHFLSSITLLRLPATAEDRALVSAVNEDAFSLSRQVSEEFDDAIRVLT